MKKIQRPLILMGIKHCGKSTQGKRLARRLGVDFFDTDDLIEQQEKKSPREIYAALGKEKFMLAEKNVCLALLEKQRNKESLVASFLCIVATGGGICENAEAVEILKSFGTIIFLQTQEKIAADRIVREADFSGEQIKNLPAYIAKENPKSENDVRKIFHNFYERRTTQYKKIADIIVEMKDASKEENTEKILAALT